MGPLMRCDSRLIELWGDSDIDTAYALALAEAQACTLATTGHLLALNDEYVWRRLRRHKERHRLPLINVRCLWCAASASLYDWWLLRHDTPEQRVQRSHAAVVTPGSSAGYYFFACGGQRASQSLLAGLIMNADLDAQERTVARMEGRGS